MILYWEDLISWKTRNWIVLIYQIQFPSQCKRSWKLRVEFVEEKLKALLRASSWGIKFKREKEPNQVRKVCKVNSITEALTTLRWVSSALPTIFLGFLDPQEVYLQTDAMQHTKPRYNKLKKTLLRSPIAFILFLQEWMSIANWLIVHHELRSLCILITSS